MLGHKNGGSQKELMIRIKSEAWNGNNNFIFVAIPH